MKVFAIVAGMAVCLAGASLSAQSYAQEVWSQLQSGYERLSDDDFTLENYIIGKLDEDQRDSWSFSMTGGREYVIIGACDRDCDDLDLFIKDPTGGEIAKDTGSDDVPIVRFTPTRTGRHTVEVEMYDCDDEPCFFGFGLFRE